jgi:aminocarboxymuconate-semialdehyde decarboxylase
MRTHRDFFQDVVGPAAGVVFVGCCVTDAADPPLPTGGATPRRQVVLGGRRVKTVDVHAHCAVPEAMALMGSTVPPEGLDLGPERLRAMDTQGIDVEALSINPYWYTAERDLARQLIRIQNEKLAELCAAQ